jgi:hypothetical protein
MIYSQMVYPSFNFSIIKLGTIVEAGDRVNYHQYQLHRNPQYWDRPTEFIPERWSEKKNIKHPFQFLPFHAGQMACLGQHMAFTEGTSGLVSNLTTALIMSASLFQKFDLSLARNQKIVPFYGNYKSETRTDDVGLVMPAMNGIKFDMKPRC